MLLGVSDYLSFELTPNINKDMQISSSNNYVKEHVFPQTVYTGHLELPDNLRKQVIRQESQAAHSAATWGWSRQGFPYTDDVVKLARLVGTQFMGIILNEFQCELNDQQLIVVPGAGKYELEFGSMFTCEIQDLHQVHVRAEKGRLYTAILWLHVHPETGHQIVLDPPVLPVGPLNFIPEQHVLSGETMKLVFIPGNMPFTLKPQVGNPEPSMIFQGNLILKER